MAKLDLSNLRTEIEERKGKKNMVSSQLGESVGTNVAPKDVFLNGLLTSLNTGKETSSTQLIKVIENKAAVKNKETPKFKEATYQPPKQNKVNENYESSPDREALLWHDLEKRKKETLAESMENYLGTGQPQQQQNQKQFNPKQQPNEGYLIETVKTIVNDYLSENFAILLEDSIKNVVIEMYAIERIKSVLGENKEMIRSEILAVIKEIQAKAKAKAQQ